MKRTLEQILMDVQAAVDASQDPIDWLDDDTLTRKNLVNKGIRRWARDNQTRWDELYDNEVLDSSVAVNRDSYDLPDDFAMLDAVYTPDGHRLEVRNIRDATTTGRYVFVSGNPRDGYVLRLGWKPASDDKLIGARLRVMRYRDALLLDKPKDVPEMSDSDFLVAYVASESQADDNPNLYAKFGADAANYLANMRDKNAQLAQGQDSNDDYYAGMGD